MITLRCMVDNLASRGTPFWGEHGVSFWIGTPDGSLLFDTGQSGDVLAHNAEWMDIDFGSCDALAISHAHYDHTGGLGRFLSLCRPGIPLHANPDLFRDRFSIKDGEPRRIGLRLSPDELMQRTTLHLSADPAEILPGVWTTGEINERLDFEGRSPQHHIQVAETWQPDTYQDDLSLVLQTAQGLVIVCGCCHAGLLNVLAHVNRIFPLPLRAIVGGTHLAGVGPDSLDRVIAALSESCEGDPPDLYLNHCTGENALFRLAHAFGDKVHTCPAGSFLIFE
jgi:7,8-dihydropterin-6-yl-methyl-4-(beta-D-ribofuranosyl)aminobenzene 5'-phosphate synthase